MRAILILSSFLFACSPSSIEHKTSEQNKKTDTHCELIVLGTIQDAGSPQIGCKKSCCSKLWANPPKDRKVVSLGIIDKKNKKSWILEASPDFVDQCNFMSELTGSELPNGVFISHGHIGHYTGLMFLGRESMGSSNLPVYVMPRMKSFLENNGPWNQLVSLNNIVLNSMAADSSIKLSDQISIIPFLVPHRDEYSETVGFKIKGPNKSILFIPDIDKWNKWNRSIIDEISKVDFAFIDGTFYQNGEIPNRDMSEIPHPFVEESVAHFNNLNKSDKSKVHFIHFNHTNPLLNKNSPELNELERKGFNVASFHQTLTI